MSSITNELACLGLLLLVGCGDDLASGGAGGIIQGGAGGVGAGGAPASDVTVDLSSAPQVVRLTQGFLHGVAAGAVPVDTIDRVDALAPRFWRVSNLYGSAAFQFIESADLRGKYGTRVQVNLNDFFSSTYGFPVVIDPGCDPNDPTCIPDYATLRAAWSSFVEAFMSELEAQGIAVDDLDLFSEPDVFWQGFSTLDEFLQLVVDAHDVIRAHAPDAFIVGPSLSRYPEEGFDQLFDYLVANEVRLDGVSWHELERPDLVAAHVAAARASVAAAYSNRPDLAPTEIHINEYGAPQSELLPGWSVAWLAAFERADVDTAARACWNIAAGWTGCERGLDGLLMSDQITPMATWALYAAYGALGAARVAATHAPSDLAVVAAPTQDGGVTILLGGASCGASGAWCVPNDLPASDDRGPSRTLSLRIDGWSAATAVARVLALPGESRPAEYLVVPPTDIPAVVRDGAAFVELPPLEDGGALVVDVAP